MNDDYTLHEMHTLSCIGDMAIGALGAWLASEFSGFSERIKKLSKLELYLIYGLFLIFLFFRKELFFEHYATRIFERMLIALVLLLIILEQCFCEKSLFKISNWKTISRLGIITYGLYCLHFVGILIATTLSRKFAFNTELWQVLIVDTMLALILTIVISSISYRFFERPFLKLKDKFAFIHTKSYQ